MLRYIINVMTICIETKSAPCKMSLIGPTNSSPVQTSVKQEPLNCGLISYRDRNLVFKVNHLSKWPSKIKQTMYNLALNRNFETCVVEWVNINLCPCYNQNGRIALFKRYCLIEVSNFLLCKWNNCIITCTNQVHDLPCMYCLSLHVDLLCSM